MPARTETSWTASWSGHVSSPTGGWRDRADAVAPMGVTSLEMAMVRANLRGEDEEAQRLFQEQLAATGEANGMAVLTYAAFVIAARRKFAPRYTRAEVIRYVAQVRALFSERPWLLDALTGE